MRHQVATIVRHSCAESFIGFVIVFDVALTWVETDSRAAGEAIDPLVKGLQASCFAVYFLEACTRFYVTRFKLFLEAWSYLDMLVVALGLFDYVITPFLRLDLSRLYLLRIMRLFRLTRLLKAMKLFRFLRELRKLLAMIGGCMKTLAWSFLLCFLVMTVWSVIAVETMNPLMQSMQKEGVWDNCKDCALAFSSVWRANLIFYQTIIAGDSWGKIAVPVAMREPWTSIVFVGAHITIVFGLLNLIIAVVVDNGAEMRQKDVIGTAKELDYEELQEKKYLHDIFETIDSDQDGRVTLTELHAGAQSISEFRHWLVVLDVDAEDLMQLFDFVDRDKNGYVEPTEFIEALYRVKHTESRTAVRFVKTIVTDIHKKVQSLETEVRRISMAAGVSRRKKKAVVRDEGSANSSEVRDVGSEPSQSIALSNLRGREVESAVAAATKVLIEAAFQEARLQLEQLEYPFPSEGSESNSPYRHGHVSFRPNGVVQNGVAPRCNGTNGRPGEASQTSDDADDDDDGRIDGASAGHDSPKPDLDSEEDRGGRPRRAQTRSSNGNVDLQRGEPPAKRLSKIQECDSPKSAKIMGRPQFRPQPRLPLGTLDIQQEDLII